MNSLNDVLRKLEFRYYAWAIVGICSYFCVIGIILHLIDPGLIGYLLLTSMFFIYFTNRETKRLKDLIDDVKKELG